MKTFSLKPAEVKKEWLLIDAQDLVLGRLSSMVASFLRGKHKEVFTPHVDCGDYVVVINAEKVHLTGNKLRSKILYWHTGWIGGIKQRTMKERLSGAHPERVLIKSVERMISRTPLGRKIMSNLKVYAGPAHPHEAQKPRTIDVASLNVKNKKR
ncbi:MAG: 50S ribosomal protein L13 [Holosporales bacterium]|jgi:large subunit ribosomal protein L13|nr:50S ribosomal protein L13 [Holosporales bacterium]